MSTHGRPRRLRRLVNRAGDQLLAGTSLAGNQNGFRVAGDAIDQCHELVHDGTGKNELRVIDLARNHSRRGWQLRGGNAALSAAATPSATGTTTATSAVGFAGCVPQQRGRELHGKTAPRLRPSEQMSRDISAALEAVGRIAWHTDARCPRRSICSAWRKERGKVATQHFRRRIAEECVKRQIAAGKFSLQISGENRHAATGRQRWSCHASLRGWPSSSLLLRIAVRSRHI